MNRSEIYGLCDRVTQAECEALGAHNTRWLGAVWTGEKRPPRQGEWYLSGAEIGAYRAHGDLSTPYHIARLVRFEEKTTRIIVAEI